MKQFFIPLLACWMLFAACHDTVGKVDALAFKTNIDDKWGLIATDGCVLVSNNTFKQQPSSVVNGMFSLPDGKGFYSLYDIRFPDRPVTPRRFARIGHFFEEVTLAQETPQSPIHIINKEGNTIASTGQYPQYDIVLAHNFHEGMALIATREGKYGYMNKQGKIVVPPLYDYAYDFHDGLALAGINNHQGETGYQLINTNGKVRFAVQLSNCQLSTRFSNDLLMFKNLHTGQCCYLDKEGIPLICLPEEVKEAYPLEYGTAVFQTSTGTGIIDSRGEMLIPPHYENAFIAGKGRIAIKNENGWAIANNGGDLLCGFQYDAVGRYYDNRLAVAYKQGKYSFIDREGKATDKNTYACIAEDSTTWQQIPQVFIQYENSAEETQPEKINRPAPSPAPTATMSKEKVKSELPVGSVIRSDGWKEIGKKNPFYEEARKILSGNLEETDAKHRQMILNYVEHLRTSYTTKDIDFLEQLFSENALIIVGTVVHTGPQAEGGYLSPSQVIYNVKSKRQYLDRLKQVFKANKSIDVKFSKFHIMRHPTQPGIYGVSLRQGYSSDIYSDDGYLFLLWDFREETAPKIHVRTWQPSLLDDRTRLSEDDIFNIQNFNLQ